MKIEFDNMRLQMVDDYNKVVSFLNANINDESSDDSHRETPLLSLNAADLSVLSGRLHDLKMKVVCLAFMSGENETFGEVGTDDTKFLDLAFKSE